MMEESEKPCTLKKSSPQNTSDVLKKLNKLEDDCASKLKATEESRSEMECLEEMGNIYLEKAKLGNDTLDYIKSTALFNASLARCSEVYRKNFIKSIEEVEENFVKMVLGQVKTTISYRKNLKHKEELMKIRNQCREKLENIRGSFPAYEVEHIATIMKKFLQSRNKAIYKLYKKISELMKNIVWQLLEDCFVVMGQPPCNYAFLGIGSLATEFVTPYSDLEAIILIEKDDCECKKYFRNLTYFLYLKIVNLGETILPTLCIRSLCEPNGYTSWFKDYITPRGFSMDGQVPWASKTPLGRKETKNFPSVELIDTPLELAELLDEVTAEEIAGYSLPNALTKVTLISGSEKLYEQYKSEVDKVLNKEPSKRKLFHSKSQRKLNAITKLLETIQEYGLDKTQFNNDILHKKSNLKSDIYRLPVLIITSLGLYFDIDLNNPWEIIEKFQEDGLLTQENAFHLLTLISIVAEIRIQTYLAYDKQGDYITALPKNASYRGDIQVFHLKYPSLIFQLYYRLIPLERNVLVFLLKEVFGNKSSDITSPFQNLLYDDSETIKKLIQKKLLLYEEAVKSLGKLIENNPNDIFTMIELGDLYSLLGKENQAKSEYGKSLEKLEDLNVTDFKQISLAKVKSNLGQVFCKLGDYQNALQYHEQSFEEIEKVSDKNSEFNISKANLLRNHATTYSSLGYFKKALDLYTESLSLHPKNSPNSSLLISDIYSEIGCVWNRLDNFDKALEYHMLSLDIKRQILGASTAHPELASSLMNIANVYLSIGDYQLALENHHQALSMFKELYGHDSLHPNVSGALNNLSLVLVKLGKYDEAESRSMESLKIKKQIFGEIHPGVANGLSNLASILAESGKYTQAITYEESALKILRKIYPQNDDNLAIADILNNLGDSYGCIGELHKSLDFLLESHHMIKRLYGEDIPSVALAVSLHNVADGYMCLGKYKEALGYFEASLKMKKEVYGQLVDHPSIQTTISRLGSCWRELGDFSKALIYHEQNVEMQKTICKGQPHADLAKSMEVVGNTWEKLGKYEKAFKSHEDALYMRMLVYGVNSENPSIASSLNNLGCVSNYQGKYKRAIDYLEHSLRLMKAIYGTEKANKSISMCLINLANSWSGLCKYKKAIEFHQQALASLEQIYGENTDHSSIVTALIGLGTDYFEIKDFLQAVVHFNQAIEMIYRLYGKNSNHPDLAVCLTNLGSCYFELSEYKSSLKTYQKAMGMIKQRFGDIDHPHLKILRQNIDSVLKRLFFQSCDYWEVKE